MLSRRISSLTEFITERFVAFENVMYMYFITSRLCLTLQKCSLPIGVWDENDADVVLQAKSTSSSLS